LVHADNLVRRRDQGLLPPAEAADLLAAYANDARNNGMPAGLAEQLDATARRAATGEQAQAARQGNHGCPRPSPHLTSVQATTPHPFDKREGAMVNTCG
jgi:hypothetical protein